MVTGDPVDLNLTMSPSSRKIPALLTKNSAQPCQIESCGEIMSIRVRPIDDDDREGGFLEFTSELRTPAGYFSFMTYVIRRRSKFADFSSYS